MCNNLTAGRDPQTERGNMPHTNPMRQTVLSSLIAARALNQPDSWSENPTQNLKMIKALGGFEALADAAIKAHADDILHLLRLEGSVTAELVDLAPNEDRKVELIHTLAVSMGMKREVVDLMQQMLDL